MQINLEEIDGVTIISLSGKLNVTTTSGLEDAFNSLLEAHKAKILIDCRQLEYISSAGLRVLLSAAKHFKKISGEIALCALSASVKQVFEISGFTSIFQIYATKDDGLKSF